MTSFGRPLHLLTLVSLLVASLLAASPGRAGEAEIALLQSYIGNWRGSGVVTGGAEPTSFNCRLQVTRGNMGKINYAGRCSLVSTNLSVAGTIAYFDAAGRYEAAMTSNAGFSGMAIGRKLSGGVVFDLRERAVVEERGDMTIESRVQLLGGEITIEFHVLFHETGERMQAIVPFSR